ncbi:secretin N-terminal domain-containing protein [Trinickia soli]|uniref:NolW-like domain-containing protein n=1 Tax=Trinickia soli TaxID=380675 RepID=A0A2N7VXI7_9BURK|nr:secretin N-terminal domain-containing protein [Trinickia soli]KAA0090455.1 hypothetical protein CIW54_03520 [Paraburkholderia sp. T12-10]PMS21872.1 hypothetical protein C0Z19_18060 [Trinickia soli]CAB3649810.1 Type 3 secretion system secretin [Trinickia soli]
MMVVSLRMLLFRLLLAGLCAFAPLGTASAMAQSSDPLAAPYALDASNQRIRDVLHRFAADHGLALRIEPGAQRDWRPARLDGWVRGETGRAFLEQLARAHRFSWFAADRRLYIGSAHDSSVERIPLGGTRADSARAALKAVGIYEDRFGWGELDGQDAVLVGGPGAYRALVRRFIAGHAKAQRAATEPEAMIFPLRYAKAGDDPPTGSGSTRRPGVAALLRELLAPGTAVSQPAFILPAESEVVPPLPSVMPSLTQWAGYAPPRSQSVPATARPREANQAAASAISPVGIVADDATNSVIVWAERSWRADIERLIDALDRPAALVSIDILVIESDSNTVMALTAASEDNEAGSVANPSPFANRIAQAVAGQRVRVLNRQTLVGRMNTHTVLAIGAEASHTGAPADKADSEQANGRSGHRGDRLDLTARIVPAAGEGQRTTAIAVDVDLLMAQPTGLPGQIWANTSSVKFETSVTLEDGAQPRLIASYPVATARAEQRAIFISAKAL